MKPKQNIIFRITDNPSIRLLFTSTKAISKIGLKMYFKILRELITYHLFCKGTTKKILIHNDFHRNNILKQSGELYFIDLESAITSRKWILKDIVFYAYNHETKEFNQQVIDYYLKELKQKHPIEYDRLNIKKEMRMAKLKFNLRRLNTNFEFFYTIRLEI